MAYPESTELGRLLQSAKKGPETVLSLPVLWDEVAGQFGNNRIRVLALISRGPNTIRYGELMFYLKKCIEHDSAVRDVLTTGHLAKVLSRGHLIKVKEHYYGFGLPNTVFDHQSQRERANYFRQNPSLPLSGRLMRDSAMKNILSLEKNILRKKE
jgi:hypothetical protein